MLLGIQWAIFLALIFLCYLAETAGSMVKPLLLIPLALCIASHAEEMQAMAVGTVCGFLLDCACQKLPGFNAVILTICCVMVSLLYRYFLRQKLLNMLWITAFCALLQAFLDYVFYYALWGLEDVELIWQNLFMPSCIMTEISAVFFYILIYWITKKCGNRRMNHLEKTNPE